MNRIIKFRAWDKNNKRFIESGDMLLGNIVGWKNTKEFEVGATSDFEIIQFTGLHDKNGKEIYEGDLFQVAKNRIYEVVFTTKGEYDEIQCGFGLRSKDIPDFIIDTYAVNEGEIIGNIYENLELLNK